MKERSAARVHRDQLAVGGGTPRRTIAAAACKQHLHAFEVAPLLYLYTSKSTARNFLGPQSKPATASNVKQRFRDSVQQQISTGDAPAAGVGHRSNLHLISYGHI